MTSGLSKEETALSLNHPGGSARGHAVPTYNQLA